LEVDVNTDARAEGNDTVVKTLLHVVHCEIRGCAPHCLVSEFRPPWSIATWK